jgi:hypothetical protein
LTLTEQSVNHTGLAISKLFAGASARKTPTSIMQRIHLNFISAAIYRKAAAADLQKFA